jgi:hypothetical protein
MGEPPLIWACVVDHGPLVLALQIHSGVVLFGYYLYSRINFKLNHATALAEWRQLLSA